MTSSTQISSLTYTNFGQLGRVGTASPTPEPGSIAVGTGYNDNLQVEFNTGATLQQTKAGIDVYQPDGSSRHLDGAHMTFDTRKQRLSIANPHLTETVDLNGKIEVLPEEPFAPGRYPYVTYTIWNERSACGYTYSDKARTHFDRRFEVTYADGVILGYATEQGERVTPFVGVEQVGSHDSPCSSSAPSHHRAEYHGPYDAWKGSSADRYKWNLASTGGGLGAQ